MIRVLGSGLLGAVAGFLTRPCCVGPVLLSLVGVSSAGFASVIETYRPLCLAMSAALVLASVWITFRREGGWPARIVAATATIVAFLIAVRISGVA